MLGAAGFRVERVRHFRAGWVWGMMTLVARRVAGPATERGRGSGE